MGMTFHMFLPGGVGFSTTTSLVIHRRLGRATPSEMSLRRAKRRHLHRTAFGAVRVSNLPGEEAASPGNRRLAMTCGWQGFRCLMPPRNDKADRPVAPDHA
jgi:hypothetical protein